MRDSRDYMVYLARPTTFYPFELKTAAIKRALVEWPEFPANAMFLDPSQRVFQDIYQGLKRWNDPEPFALFTMVVKSCDYIAACAFSDGKWGAGVANEVAAYFNSRSPEVAKVFAVFHPEERGDRFVPRLITTWREFKSSGDILTVPETRKRIADGIV